MATEGPLLHDGAQCTAGVDMSSTGGLSGFNGSGQFLCVKISAARTVVPCAANTDQFYGILQNDPTTGFAADVGIFGISKAQAGAAVSAGAKLMSDASGRVITFTTPGTNECVGYALEAATGANQIITVFVGPRGMYP